MTVTPRAGDRVLTVRDPWAFLLTTGQKMIENRSWATHYRGPLWIHAAQGFDLDDFDWCRERGILVPDHPEDWPHGVIGKVELVDCLPVRGLPIHLRSHWSAEGPVCWVVRSAVRLTSPVECKGRLGLWPFPG